MNTELNQATQMLPDVTATLIDCNNIMTTAGVANVFQCHYPTGGIQKLITEILTDSNAIFPACYDKISKAHYSANPFRKLVLAASLTADEILAEVENRFSAGSTRYPYETVIMYLSVFMVRKGQIGKVKQTNYEDANRPKSSNRPRQKFFLVQ